MRLDWQWLSLQVGLPIVAPVLLSSLFVAGWISLDATFAPRPQVIVDITPWALAVYCLTLIGSAFRSVLSSQVPKPALTVALVIVAGAVIVYYAFLVIRRHDDGFVIPPAAYYVTGLLTFVSVALCYRAR